MRATIVVSLERRDGTTVSRTVDVKSSDYYGREPLTKFRERVREQADVALNAVLGKPATAGKGTTK